MRRAERDGRAVVVKDDDGAEATGLRWITVPGGPRVPEMLGEDPLVVPFIPSAGPSPAAAGAFGRALAVLHVAGGSRVRRAAARRAGGRDDRRGADAQRPGPGLARLVRGRPRRPVRGRAHGRAAP